MIKAPNFLMVNKQIELVLQRLFAKVSKTRLLQLS
jgi:hypothetical protein